MITFKITKDDTEKLIQCELKDTFLIVKKQIMKEYSCQCPYIDLYFLLDKPIRSLGKFNLEKGLFPRTLDRYTLDRYELDGKVIPVTFKEVEEYENKVIRHKQMKQGGVYRPPQNGSIKSGDEISVPESVFSCDIDSHDDFPPIGGK